MAPASDVAIPSPRAPRPWMARCSTKSRPDEKLKIAVTAGDRGRKAHDIAAAKHCGMCCDLRHHRLVDARIAYDSFAVMNARGLELRLHQREHMSWPRRQRQRGRQDQFEGNEAHVDGDEIGQLVEERGIEGANVGALERDDPAVAAQTWMQLASSHIDRVDT